MYINKEDVCNIKNIIDTISKFLKGDDYVKATHSDYLFASEVDTIREKAYELDESGVLAMLSLVSLCRKRFEDTYVSLVDILTLSDPIVFYRKILECMNSPTVVGYRTMIVNAIAYAIEMMSEQKTIGNKTAFESVVEESLNDVVKKLGNLQFEVYLNSGKPYMMPSVFSKTIKEFGSLAECLTTIEKSRDGVYVCYISINGTLDGWFGFFFKSNGNIFSYNDRIDEEYVGQHENIRNGRYVESKVDGIFPYELCEFSDERDYKGYSKSMSLGEGKDILLSCGQLVSPRRRNVEVLLRTLSKSNLNPSE